MTKVLITGWFSFEAMGATAGDLAVCSVIAKWLQEAGREYDIAFAKPFRDGVDWRAVDPSNYSDLIFACGPYRECNEFNELRARFAHVRAYGINLSMLEPMAGGRSPFNRLWERDSDRATRPDLAFLAHRATAPIVGLALVHPQREYGDRGRHKQVKEAFQRLIQSREMAVVPIDTRLDENAVGLRSVAEIESLIARMDVMLTTRLHGMVLAVKHGVPAVVVDPISGGAKVTQQARVIEWPVVLAVENADEHRLRDAFAFCLTREAKEKARASGRRARLALISVHDEFIDTFRD